MLLKCGIPLMYGMLHFKFFEVIIPTGGRLGKREMR